MIRISGSIVALPTPFRAGEVSLHAFRRMIERQIEAGTDGFVVAGTTGESATLTSEERRRLIECCVETAAGRVPVIAGVGTNCTRTTCEEARAAEEAGANALLVVTPYYNRPSQRGLEIHYSTVADTVRAPVVLYNVPKRTGVDLLPATVERLVRRHLNIVAIKEAAGSLERIRELVALREIDILCGEDALAADAVKSGAVGLIGVVANIAPAEVAGLVSAARPGGDALRAAELADEVAPLLKMLELDVNPVPVKAALERMGLGSAEVRPPLAQLAPEDAAQLERELERAGLIELVI